MPVYSYEAVYPDRARQIVSGVITADTPRLARHELRARGLSIEHLSPQEAKSRGRFASALFPLRRRGGATHKVISFIRELATLLGVGVPLIEAMDDIARQHRGRFRTTLLLMRDRVAAGLGLAEAMREHPLTFDELCVQIIEVGEDSGTLDTALERLARFKERSRQLKGKATTALIYPCIVLTMAIGISIFLMTFVVPTILQPLVELNRPLPLPTRIVKSASDALIRWGWLMAAGSGGVMSLIVAVVRTQRGRRIFDAAMLRVPLFGALTLKAALVRIAVVMSTLLKSGVEFVCALQVAQRVTSNIVIKDALGRCEQAVAAGSDIGAALEKTAVFPSLVVQVFSVGQQSGRLEEMLDRLAEDYDHDVAVTTQRLGAAIEPALILTLASVVLLVALATMLPILEAGDVLQQ